MHQPKIETKEVSFPVNGANYSTNKCTCGALSPKKPKLPAGVRRIKIQPTWIQLAWKNKFVPQILLKGEWLRKNGFECKGYVIIVEEAGKLVISLEED